MARDFCFTYEGEEFWLDDLSLEEAAGLEGAMGEWGTWRPIGEARHRLTLMTAFLRRTRSEDEVAGIISGLTLGQSRAMWDLRDEDLPDSYEDGVPKQAADPSTPTS